MTPKSDFSDMPHEPIVPHLKDKHLMCFGFGYTAEALSDSLMLADWRISGTTTDEDKADAMAEHGIRSMLFDTSRSICAPFETLSDVTHILLSIPPDDRGDLAYILHDEDIAKMPNLEWIGYLSTTGVYGNHDGGWVSEDTMSAPTSRRGSLRHMAEGQWRKLANEHDLPLHIFRLSGIYGPGRSALNTVRSGHARRIEKPGQAFNRVHIDDIVQTLIASMNKPNPMGIYNLADDHPAPSHEVIAYACTLMGVDVPPLQSFNEADLAPMIRSFYKDNKRVKNDRIKDELGVKLLYPDYKSGLNACYEAEKELFDLVSEND